MPTLNLKKVFNRNASTSDIGTSTSKFGTSTDDFFALIGDVGASTDDNEASADNDGASTVDDSASADGSVALTSETSPAWMQVARAGSPARPVTPVCHSRHGPGRADLGRWGATTGAARRRWLAGCGARARWRSFIQVWCGV